MDERELIRNTIKGFPELNMDEIALKLGVSLRTLRKRMIDYKIVSGRPKGRRLKQLKMVS